MWRTLHVRSSRKHLCEKQQEGGLVGRRSPTEPWCFCGGTAPFSQKEGAGRLQPRWLPPEVSTSCRARGPS